MRIGFAYNPTDPEARELLARGMAWCAAHEAETWDAAAEDGDLPRGEAPFSCSTFAQRNFGVNPTDWIQTDAPQTQWRVSLSFSAIDVMRNCDDHGIRIAGS